MATVNMFMEPGAPESVLHCGMQTRSAVIVRYGAVCQPAVPRDQGEAAPCAPGLPVRARCTERATFNRQVSESSAHRGLVVCFRSGQRASWSPSQLSSPRMGWCTAVVLAARALPPIAHCAHSDAARYHHYRRGLLSQCACQPHELMLDAPFFSCVKSKCGGETPRMACVQV